MLRSISKKYRLRISERGLTWRQFPELLKVAKTIIPETLGRKGGPFWDLILNRFLLLKLPPKREPGTWGLEPTTWSLELGA